MSYVFDSAVSVLSSVSLLCFLGQVQPNSPVSLTLPRSLRPFSYQLSLLLPPFNTHQSLSLSLSLSLCFWILHTPNKFLCDGFHLARDHHQPHFPPPTLYTFHRTPLLALQFRPPPAATHQSRRKSRRLCGGEQPK